MESAVDVFADKLLTDSEKSERDFPGAYNVIRQCIYCGNDTGVGHTQTWAFNALCKAGLNIPCVCSRCYGILFEACERYYNQNPAKADIMGF